MATKYLTLPKDPHSEIYYDADRLVVGFRKRTSRKAPSEMRAHVLRVVVQCFGWVIEDRFFQPGSVISVGTGKKNTFRIPTQGLQEGHPLIEYTGSNTVRLMVNNQFDGILEMDDQLKTLAQAVPSKGGPMQVIDMKRGARGCVEHGTILIYFEEITDPERAIPPKLFTNMLDKKLRDWILVSLGIHLLLLLILKLMPAKPAEVTLEELPQQFQRIIVSPQKAKEYIPRLAMQGLTRGKQGMEGEGERAPGPEGRRGKGIPGKGARVTGRDINKSGILDVFSKKGSKGVLADLIGGSGLPGSVDTAFDKAARYGLPGEREIREGKGLQGSGTGGGGLSTSIGQGLGTKGRGGGAKGPGLADFGSGRADVAVSASIDEEEVFITGNIPKEVIARIINNHLGAIQYCYERQLTVSPKLRGKIVTDFIIGLEGRVTSARIKSSSMGSPPVEQCVSDVIKRIRFPKPGGGIVEVIYPFLFRVAG